MFYTHTTYLHPEIFYFCPWTSIWGYTGWLTATEMVNLQVWRPESRHKLLGVGAVLSQGSQGGPLPHLSPSFC